MNRELKKAVREYYKWHGESKAEIIRMLHNKDGVPALLIHFIGEQGDELSGIALYQEWKDGHYDVEEIDASFREDEEQIINDYEMFGATICDE